MVKARSFSLWQAGHNQHIGTMKCSLLHCKNHTKYKKKRKIKKMHVNLADSVLY